MQEEFAPDRVFSDLKETVRAVDESVYQYKNERLHWSLNPQTPSSVYEQAA